MTVDRVLAPMRERIGHSHKPTVLVVDDDRVAQAWVVRALGDEMSIVAQGSAEAGLEWLGEHPMDVDAIVLDLDLPGMGGLDFLKTVRRDAAVAQTPVVVVAGDGQASTILAEGADDFVKKPVEAAELVARIRMALRLRSAARRYEALVSHLPIGVWELDEHGDCVYANAEMRRILGLDGADATCIPEVLSQAFGRARAVAKAAPAPSGAVTREFEFHRPEQGSIWVRDTSFAVLDDRGNVVGQNGVVEDITEQLKWQGRLRAFFDRSWSAMFIEDFSTLETWFAGLRKAGVDDVGRYIDQHPLEFADLVRTFRVTAANRTAAELFEVGSIDDGDVLGSL